MVCRMCHNRNTFEQQFVTALASEFENFRFWSLAAIKNSQSTVSLWPSWVLMNYLMLNEQIDALMRIADITLRKIPTKIPSEKSLMKTEPL
jgi:hypothetical protein